MGLLKAFGAAATSLGSSLQQAGALKHKEDLLEDQRTWEWKKMEWLADKESTAATSASRIKAYETILDQVGKEITSIDKTLGGAPNVMHSGYDQEYLNKRRKALATLSARASSLLMGKSGIPQDEIAAFFEATKKLATTKPGDDTNLTDKQKKALDDNTPEGESSIWASIWELRPKELLKGTPGKIHFLGEAIKDIAWENDILLNAIKKYGKEVGKVFIPNEDSDIRQAIASVLEGDESIANAKSEEDVKNIIKDKGNIGSKKYENAMTRLKKFYRLNSEDVKLLEEYGMEGANGLSKTNVVDVANVERRMEQIYHKMDTAAHIYTQGATIDIFMPEIMGKKGIKPLTLYKRMAYAATVNTYNNMKLAHETGSYSRMLMQTLGGLVAGQTMIGVYDAFLGQAPPKQNGEWWEQLFITMWKGEMGGLLSEGFRVAAGVPGSSLVEHTVRPAIYDHATMLLGVASDGINKKVNLSQGFDKILRSSFGAYHQGKKMLERKVSPYNGGYLEYRKLYGEFMQSAKPEKGDIEIAKTENSPYFVDFRNAFNLGTEKEFAKQYILSTLAMASDYYREGYASTGIRVRTMQQAYKQALKTMDLKMTLLNPNKGTPAKDSIVSRLRAKQFLSFLTPEQLKEVNNLESQYWAKRRRYMSSLSKYFKEFNVPEMKKDFDWD